MKVKQNSGFSIKYVTNYEDNLYAVSCLWSHVFKQMKSNAEKKLWQSLFNCQQLL